MSLLTIGYFALLIVPINTESGILPPLGNFLNPFSGLWQNAEPNDKWIDLEQRGFRIDLPVRILYDERLVPHVFAENEMDQAFAQGYLHAKHRLWQMDITARQAAGRLAEVFGSRVLFLDQRHRRLGMVKSATEYAEKWSQCPEYPILEAYVRGVNSYIRQLSAAELPFEFKLFNYWPELWSTKKTALVFMSMNLVLCGRNEDLAATNSYQLLGKKQFDYLFPEWNPQQSPIIPKTVVWDFDGPKFPPQQDLIGGTYPSFQVVSSDGVGSNNWAIAPSLTRNGNPILCNDPHLQLTLPSIWYEMQLASNDLNVYGVTFPGVPNVIIGFNSKMAWGQTNVGIDVSDLFEIEWVDEDHLIYRLDGQDRKVEWEVERYLVHGAKEVKDTIKYTHWGPVVVDDTLSLALHWLPNIEIEGCALQTFIGLNKGSSYDDYIDALKYFGSPPQNFVFASSQGDIAIKVQGKLPIKRKGQGKFVQNGTRTTNGWGGYIPFKETPMLKNPGHGYVASANQHSTDTTYPYYYHGFFEDYRGRYLNERLAEMEQIQIADMQALQNSTYSQLAADLCPLLVDLVQNIADGDSIWQKLNQWTYCYDRDSDEASFFEEWKDRFYRTTWDEFIDSNDLLTPEIWRTIEMVKRDPSSKYFDLRETKQVEDARDIAVVTYQQMVETMDSIKRVGGTVNWQEFRRFDIPHLSRIPSFSAQDIKVGGSAKSLNAVSDRHAPSWRMIVELSDSVRAWGVLPGGASGNPGSKFYKTGIEEWSSGKYFQLHFLSDASQVTENQLLFREILLP